MRHTISVLVQNKFGVLTRVAGLFSGRGFNIDSLNVAPTHDPSMSRMTIVTRGDDTTLDQIVKQLNKLVDSLEVQDFRDGEYVDRELVLVRVGVDSQSRAEVMQITDIFRAKIVDVQPASLTIEITGSESKVSKLQELDLHANIIGPPGGEALGNMLLVHAELTALDVQNNVLGAEGLALLRQAVQGQSRFDLRI